MLTLLRDTVTSQSTTGILLFYGTFQCYTLEDVPRAEKVAGKTCIPAGVYEVEMRFSPRFKERLPWIKNVPGFEWILIHSGNVAKDTEGCVLVGTSRTRDFVGQSRIALGSLIAKMPELGARIDIRNAF